METRLNVFVNIENLLSTKKFYNDLSFMGNVASECFFKWFHAVPPSQERREIAKTQ